MKFSSPSRSVPPPPTRLGRYDVRAKIAEGGMATVYVGTTREPSGAVRAVALKMIRDELALNRDFVSMFVDEAKIVSRLKHPNIVEVYELGVDGPRIFLAMELLFGQSLWHVWDACKERGVRLRYDLIAWIGARVAEGLHSAHEMRGPHGEPLDIVHRDVNATNIFVTYDGQIKIIDFGLAKAANRMSKTAAGVIKGKVAYMSPEQAIGAPVDRRTDVFALGTTLWELSVDRRLFKHTDEVETLKRVHAAEVPNPLELVEGYPPPLWAVLRRALARDRSLRHATAAELARELDACSRIEGRTISTRTMAGVMPELFAEQRARQERWMADASTPDRPAPKDTMQPPSGFYAAHVGVDANPIPPPPRVPRERAGMSMDAFAPPVRPPAVLPYAPPPAAFPPLPPPVAPVAKPARRDLSYRLWVLVTLLVVLVLCACAAAVLATRR